jgi:hypothetical protein
LILALIECSLRSVFGNIKAEINIAYIERIRLNIIESSSLSSKLDNKLYHIFSLSIVALLYIDSLELRGNKSSDYLLNKSRLLNKVIKVAIINKIN